MTREEAKNKALNIIDDYIKKEGENAIALMAPQPGKNSWTWKELRESVVNDTPLEGGGGNLIDDVILMDIWEKEHESNNCKIKKGKI